MTKFFVGVANPFEAEQALAAGADGLDALGPLEPIRAIANGCLAAQATTLETARERLDEGASWIGCPPSLAVAAASLARERGRRCAATFAAHEPFDPSGLAQLAQAGVTAACLQSYGGRLLAQKSIAQIADFLGACVENGLQTGLAGRLQAPDIPRLLALKPDFLGVRSALLTGGGLDARAIRLFRALIPQDAGIAQAREGKPRSHPQETDLVFVRDYVAAIFIGAYAHERNAKQRVRFNVEAQVRRRTREDDDFANLFSYDVIIDAIARLTEGKHFALVETLAERLAQATLADPHVARVTVEIEKLDVVAGAVGVKITRYAHPGSSQNPLQNAL